MSMMSLFLVLKGENEALLSRRLYIGSLPNGLSDEGEATRIDVEAPF